MNTTHHEASDDRAASYGQQETSKNASEDLSERIVQRLLQELPLLTRREHFAAMAMQGLLAEKYPADVSVVAVWGPSSIAESAVRHADALIEALNK